MKILSKRVFSFYKKTLRKHGRQNVLIFILSCLLVFVSIGLIWMSSLKIPALDTVEDRRVSQSTKIYDGTGKIILFDFFQNTKRTVVPFENISEYAKNATLSIEDKTFYNHYGIKPLSIMRAVFVDIVTLEFSQGASTITQQVVKNSILTGDKTPTRKLKELVLALKLEKILSKEEIFSIYLNEIPYGGNLYGIEEASQAYFGKSSKDITVAEAAYLAALPKAPTYYSPYGKNKDKLEERKNLVLKEMYNDGKISDTEYKNALDEKVVFIDKLSKGIKAPHFVMFVRNYLEEKYGIDAVEHGGLKVTTTLNYTLQVKAEEIAKKYALENKKNFNGENDAFVAINPKNGAILTMVGSRDYFDTEIDGNFNVAIAHRQSGSTFKPFVYAQAFIKGYTPETIVFDLPTQFGARCAPDDRTSDISKGCYAPDNYDSKFKGPVTLREALAQSRNVPSVKTLYLAGVKASIDLATRMGVNMAGDENLYGLTLVLGGGEVSLLDMTSGYGVFATEGVRNPYTAILKIEDKNGNVLEEIRPKPMQVIDPEITRKVSDILNDNVARTPLFGANSNLYFQGRDVAAKTGTTNSYRDTWLIGYTPSVVMGAWAGNNDNTPMTRSSGQIVAPMWRAFMNEVLKTVPEETFTKPLEEDSYSLKPVLRGKWQGGLSTFVQNPVVDPYTPYTGEQEILSGGVHDILYWLNKDDPRGETPVIPESDSQFNNWEYSVRIWAMSNGYQ